MKIWEISCPEYIKENPEYLELDFPDPRVTIPGRTLYG